jgi:site-specific DNA recombinase
VRVAAYVRVSTTRQVQQQTLEQQLERLTAYAHDQGWSLAGENIVRDDGDSGTGLARPGLDRLRDQVHDQAFNRMLITAPDRLARNDVQQMVLLDEFTHQGCQVAFVERPMSDDPHDQLPLQMRGTVAEYERYADIGIALLEVGSLGPSCGLGGSLGVQEDVQSMQPGLFGGQVPPVRAQAG